MEHLKLFTNILLWIGLWPYREGPKWKKIIHKIFVVCIAFVVGYGALSLVLKIVLDFKNIDNIATTVDFATVFLSGFFRYTYSILRGDAYLRMVKTMYTEFAYESFNQKGPKMTMAATKALAVKCGVVYLAFSYAFSWQMGLTPLIGYLFKANQTTIELTFVGWHPFPTESPFANFMVFLQQALTLIVGGVNYLALDSFWYATIIVTIGQLKLIEHSINHILQEDMDEKDLKEKNKPLQMVPIWSQANIEFATNLDEKLLELRVSRRERRLIDRCVLQHQRVRRFMEQLEDILNYIVIVDFLHGVISITFLLLDVLVAVDKKDYLHVLHVFEYLMVSIVHMFIYDTLGNELIVQEEKVGWAMYGVSWYRSLKPMKDPLMMTIAASRNPIKLTGGKFFVLSNEFFANAMQVIFSYFTVIYQVSSEAAEEVD